jgi:hypothetical protein
VASIVGTSYTKIFTSEAVMTRMVGSWDKKTFRKCVWLFLDGILNLEAKIILWENPFDIWNGTDMCIVTVDGMDCPIVEPFPFCQGNYSHKLNTAGVQDTSLA